MPVDGLQMQQAAVYHDLPAKRVTDPHAHGFFGYYDKSPWDASGRWLLGMRATFMDRPPEAEDVLQLGVMDVRQGYAWRTVATSRAWNWQQGCMMQWLGDGARGEIIFNDRMGNRFVSRIINVATREEHVIGRPIYAVNRAGTHGVSVNFARLHHQRPGYGYAGLPDPWQGELSPEDDGLYAVDLATGESQLIFSLADAAGFEPQADFPALCHRFNHVQFGARPDRFAVLHRFKAPDSPKVGETRLITLNLDGSAPCILNDHGFCSHYDWRGESELVAWSRRRDIGDSYFLFRDQSHEISVIGEGLYDCDGHCSFSPDGAWMLTDTYPDATDCRTLILHHVASNQRFDIGRFYAPPMRWDIRCDLHPRWSRDGRQVCIDSAHEGFRGQYILDVTPFTQGR